MKIHEGAEIEYMLSTSHGNPEGSLLSPHILQLLPQALSCAVSSQIPTSLNRALTHGKLKGRPVRRRVGLVKELRCTKK